VLEAAEMRLPGAKFEIEVVLSVTAGGLSGAKGNQQQDTYHSSAKVHCGLRLEDLDGSGEGRTAGAY